MCKSFLLMLHDPTTAAKATRLLTVDSGVDPEKEVRAVAQQCHAEVLACVQVSARESQSERMDFVDAWHTHLSKTNKNPLSLETAETLKRAKMAYAAVHAL